MTLGTRLRRMGRSALGGVFFVLFGTGALAIGGLLFPPLLLVNARRAMRALVRLSWTAFVWGGRLTGLFRVEISPEDRARLAAARGRVVVANHLTLIDVVVLAVFLPDATALAKAAARGNVFYSWIVRGAFLVNDEPTRALAAAQTLLAQGVDLIVFPQGTRVPPGAPLGPLRRGAAQIALRAGAPILPVTLTCDPPVLGKGQPWHDLADRAIVWRLRVGEEIPVAPPRAAATRAAAVALTEQIRARLERKEV